MNTLAVVLTMLICLPGAVALVAVLWACGRGMSHATCIQCGRSHFGTAADNVDWYFEHGCSNE